MRYFIKEVLKKKILAFVMFFQLVYVILFFVLDNHAARYGKGVLQWEYRLTDDGVCIARFPTTSIYKAESGFWLPSTRENAKPFVKSINRYALKEGQLFFDLDTESGRYWYYKDNSLMPFSTTELEGLDLSWINIASQPIVYYYWKLIFIIMTLTIMGTLLYLAFFVIHFLMKQKEIYLYRFIF